MKGESICNMTFMAENLKVTAEYQKELHFQT